MKVPKEGDIVLVKDDNMARSSWKLVKIQHLRIGLDGEIRSAEILLPNCLTVVRAINFLYPLELPTLQEETNHQPIQDEKNVQRQRTKFNIADDAPAPEERLTVEPNDDSFIDGKKRKASLIARRRIFEGLRDNGTPVLFCFSSGRLS